jgi:alpha-tubulin suppressor-like RCC1 family protein
MTPSRRAAGIAFASGLAALVLACGDDAPSPTSPEAALEVAPAAALTFSQVSAGVEHACGVTTDGQAWCWGANSYGELGIPVEDSPDPCSSTPCSLRPVAVSGGHRFRHVAAGSQFTCGLTTGDEVFCWGRNDAGQLGTGSTAGSSSTPTEIAGDRTYRQVRAGVGNVACAISTTRDAFCWGSGRLGNASNSSRTPVKVSRNLDWLQLSVGSNYVCGITTIREAWCWGVNNRGQLGDGTTTARGIPARSAQGLSIGQIEAGGAHTCAVLTDARAFCWGDGVGTGDGSGSGRRLNPTAVAGSRRWDNVSAGVVHSCGVTIARRGFCWGRGTSGDLGNGSTADRFRPSRVSGSIDFVSISASFVVSCGVAKGGKAWCWGTNGNGQLGDGSVVERSEPVEVAAP